MLRWVVMRHARAPQGSGNLPDHERPLDERGQQEASDVGAKLVRHGWWPDRVLSSDARRTRQTWGAAMVAGPPVEDAYFYSFYERGAVAALEAAAALPGSVQTLLTLGHNPENESLIGWLSGELVGMGTAHAALLTCSLPTWKEAVVARRWTLVEVLRPADPLYR